MDRVGGIPVMIACSLLMASRSSAQSVSFVAPRELDVGEQPDSIAVADFNGDGVNDLAVVVDTPPPAISKGVAIMLGLGDGNFAAPQVVFRGPAVLFSIAAADFNGDGVADLAVVDFNGDGNLDVVVTNMAPSNSVSVLLGNGDGTFQSANVTEGVSPFVPWSVAVADFDEDGRLDVVVGLHSGSHFISVLLGDGEGGFQPPV